MEIPSQFTSLQDYAHDLSLFLLEFKWIGDFYAVDFISTGYIKRLPNEWQSIVLGDGLECHDDFIENLCELVKHGTVMQHWPASLKVFVSTAIGLRMPRDHILKFSPAAQYNTFKSSTTTLGAHQSVSKTIDESSDLPSKINNQDRFHSNEIIPRVLHPEILIGMSLKKQAEVTNLAFLIAKVAHKTHTFNIIDIGAGQGYLSTALALQYHLNVIALELNDSNCITGMGRYQRIKELMHHHHKPSFTSLQFIHYTVGTESVSELIDNVVEMANLEHTNIKDGWIVCGLHTCGTLASNLIRSFAQSSDRRIKALVNLGCCYQVLTEASSHNNSNNFGFPLLLAPMSLGPNLLMLSCQASARWVRAQIQESLKSLFYRAVLQTIIISLSIAPLSEKSISKLGKLGRRSMVGPVVYTRAALNRLGIQCTLSDAEIESYFERQKDAYNQISVVWALRTLLAEPTEALILLDRFMYLQQHHESHLVPITDCETSPRNMCLVSFKPRAN